MNHWQSYANTFPADDPRPSAFQITSKKFVDHVITTFDHTTRVNGLLFGQVQSGKTTHTFSVIAATADADPGFSTFVYLTSNSTQLQQQTLGDALQRLNQTFEVSDTEDELRFKKNHLKPNLVVLNKDPNVLYKWIGIISSEPRTKEGPIFVIDDEGDSASQNTLINKGDKSTIYSQIQKLRSLGTGSVYLQVTATPQALFLQSLASGEKPKFVHYFDPGEKYLGGEFFFGRDDSITHHTISETDFEDLMKSDFSSKGLTQALAFFVVVAAYFQKLGKSNANCLVHPHYSRAAHKAVQDKVNKVLKELLRNNPEAWVEEELTQAYFDLNKKIEQNFTIEDLWNEHKKGIPISTVIINADNKVDEDEYRNGFNVIVGANAIGRGVAFPHLQTVYYTRKAKTPQADTFWQHSRIFGYDRMWQALRIFMPASLFRLFRVLQDQNSRLIEMIKNGDNSLLQIPLPRGISPARKVIIDRKKYNFVVGGTNYFPPKPNQENAEILDTLFEKFGESYTGPVSVDLVIAALKQASENDSDWRTRSFIKAIELELKTPKATLLLRRNRKISADKGSMLSPNDREYGDKLPDEIVLTAYRVNGLAGGWALGKDFWLINIKLPGNLFYHEVD